ncbi:potassium-transporting ATPase subunit KdpC [Pseudomonas oryzihabitans]|uniref:potassium-transporting ATPase subunit KdpC n=1 Tax=Pseudomonas oryzihabitans TaxID=47885 RepID=UPI0028647A37|nr:potassium-transporting ATPase subunit KdpC [Pseudomonas psychrotolerans]MDR6676341.1 K+-transporting ATPase ATPase C chain [Pseudomonas psychrotolerans]
MLIQLRSAALMLVLLTVLTGGVYPLLVTVLGQALFADQAGGSLIQRADGSVVGSRLIAQKFTGPEWFQPRPSAGDYATVASSASNLAQSAPALRERIEKALPEVQVTGQGPVPQELVTTSASGLDPDLTPAGVRYQIARIAAARGLAPERLEALVREQTHTSLFGPATVNVLLLNLALADLSK